MYEPKVFELVIPVRPKAIQSTRFTRTGFAYVDPKVRQWKKAVADAISSKKPLVPSPFPCEVVRAVYQFQWPKSITKKAQAAIKEAMDRGEDIPYLSSPDLSDNANKGLADVITAEGFWEDDKLLWRVAPGAVIKKIYGDVDQIELTVRETPFVMTVNGRTAYDNWRAASEDR